MNSLYHAKIAMLSLALLGLPVLSAHATSLASSISEAVEPQKQGDIEYISGGIGSDEVESFKLVQKGYNLRLTFSTGQNNAYTADVDVCIRKLNGKNVFSLEKAGPLVYVKLPVGKYEVSSTLDGEKKKSIVTVGSHAKSDVNIHW